MQFLTVYNIAASHATKGYWLVNKLLQQLTKLSLIMPSLFCRPNAHIITKGKHDIRGCSYKISHAKGNFPLSTVSSEQMFVARQWARGAQGTALWPVLTMPRNLLHYKNNNF